MLKPQANCARDLVCLNGIWNFAVSSESEIEAINYTGGHTVIPPTLQIPVPASYNDILVDHDIRDHVGWVFYQREVIVPRGWSSSGIGSASSSSSPTSSPVSSSFSRLQQDRVYLRFDAATHRGRVYIDDKFVCEHIGGYTPFAADITELIMEKRQFRLTVAVSNELTWETIPPGRVELIPDASGGPPKKKQHYQHDFYNYAGLARSVWMYRVSAVHINDITVVTEIADDGNGIIDYGISTSEPLVPNDAFQADITCKVTLVDESGNTVVENIGTHGRLTVKSPHLWQPGAAYLYQLRAEIVFGKNTIVDTYAVNVGVRSVKVQKNRFLINNQPFYFAGFGKHEDSPVRGKGYDASFMIHDFQLMKWTGANSFRTSHYPYAEEYLEYADRHGIVVIDETAAVGLHLGIAAGVFGFKAPNTFSPDAVNDKTKDAHAHAIRELVARDKNHPSVVMWMISNEPASSEAGAREYFEPLVALTRQLDQRPVCFSNMGLATSETDQISDLFDVLCLNRYYGWYSQNGDLKSAEIALEKDLLAWESKYGKPMIMTEYGADTQVGVHAVLDTPWTEEYQQRFLEMFHRVHDRVDSLVGEHVWNFADFNTTSAIIRVDGNKKGIFTRDRKPKSAAYVLRKRWRTRAGLEI